MTSSLRRPIAVAVLAAAAVVAAIALTGRGDSEEKGADPGIPAPSAASGAPVVPGGVSTSSTSDVADAPTTRTGLPEGFPSAQVPVVAGTVVGGSKGAAGDPYDYTVIVEVRGRSVASVVEGITQQLTARGFTAEATPATEAFSAVTFRSATYDVPVNVVRDRGKTTVTYLVIKK